jgi:sorbitol/mannitol transport system permease protein
MELGILLGTIYLIQVYDQIAVMTGGGPGSTNVPYFVFQKSIGGGWEFGQASSYSIVVVHRLDRHRDDRAARAVRAAEGEEIA